MQPSQLLHGFAPLPESNVLTPSVLSGVLHYPLLTPQAWIGINGKEKKDTYTCFLQQPSLAVPFTKTGGTRGVRQSDEGSLWAQRLALLSSDDACSRSQNQRYTTCQLWQASCEARDMLCQQTQSALAGWAVLHSHVNHCLQLIRTSERWICSDVVKECLLYKQLWTRFAVYTLDKILVPPVICNNWLTLTLIIQ